MTRKDYVALAKALGRAWSLAERLDNGMGDAIISVAYAVEQVSLVLEADNPRFSVATFEAAIFEARDAESALHAEWERSRVG